MALKGLNKVLKDLRKFGEEVEQEINDNTLDIATQIQIDAVVRAPKNNGKLAQSIKLVPITKSEYKVVVTSPYGAYVEFGTGKKVKIPTEMKEIASSFRGKKGNFKEGLQAITDWCKKKGIDESLAYIIFMSILKKGITPQPFLYPAFVKGRKEYLKQLKQVLKEKTKKYG